jgi:hypothetical protein
MSEYHGGDCDRAGSAGQATTASFISNIHLLPTYIHTQTYAGYGISLGASLNRPFPEVLIMPTRKQRT